MYQHLNAVYSNQMNAFRLTECDKWMKFYITTYAF